MARIAKGHHYGSPANRQAGTTHHSPNNICEACECFRSAHRGGRNGAPCTVHDDCPGMTFTPDVPRQPRRLMTEAEATQARDMLERGLSYVEAARKLRWLGGDNALRHRFPEYANRNAPVKAELGNLSDRLKRLGLG